MKLKLILILAIFILTVNSAYSQTPNYEVILKLSNHNINAENKQSNLSVDIIGYGTCDSGQLTITSETPLTYSFTGKSPLFNAHKLSGDALKEAGTEFVNYCVEGKCNFEPPREIVTNSVDIDLDKSLFSTEETRLQLKSLNIGCDCLSEGGEYTLDAAFFCKKGNESFIFKDNTQLRVMFEGESKQYTTTYVWAVIAVIISILALIATVTKDFLIPWVVEPKLTITGKNKLSYIEEAQNLGKKRYLRLKIENLHKFWKSNAKNCYVKLVEIKKNNKLQPFTPVLLKWSSYDEEIGPIIERRHNLAKGEPHFVDLCHEEDNGKRTLRFQTPINPILLESFGPGKYTFKVGIFGDNFEPKFEEFEIIFTENYGELKFIG